MPPSGYRVVRYSPLEKYPTARPTATISAKTTSRSWMSMSSVWELAPLRRSPRTCRLTDYPKEDDGDPKIITGPELDAFNTAITLSETEDDSIFQQRSTCRPSPTLVVYRCTSTGEVTSTSTTTSEASVRSIVSLLVSRERNPSTARSRCRRRWSSH